MSKKKMSYELRPIREKKISRIREFRISERMELDLLRRASFLKMTKEQYAHYALELHLYGVCRANDESVGEEAHV